MAQFGLHDLADIFAAQMGIPTGSQPGGSGQGSGSGSGGDQGEGVPVTPVGGAGGQGFGNGGSGSGSFSEGIGDFFSGLAKRSTKVLIVLGIVVILVLLGAYWWFHPAINLHSEQVWGWLIIVALLVSAALIIASLRRHADRDRSRLLRRLALIPLAVIVVFGIGKVAGFAIIPGNAQRYASVLETTDGNFAEDIEEVNYSEVPIIDGDSAILLGNRAMGSIPEYVSQFEISDMYSQINYQGKPVRVSPLEYADLFKWFTNKETGIPAYVIVDMTTQEAKVVRLEEPMKYVESDPLGRNIDRYVQLKFPTYMFDEKSFEIDEDGVPWWVFPVQKRTIGLFDGTDIQRVVLVNASTGECQDYAIEDCPQWVDRAYPSDLLVQQYNWSGLYSGGWWNSWIGQKNVVRTTPGTDGSLGYNYIAQNDDVYLYTGVSSVTADNSIIGFILVNQRTGDSRFFGVAGATEDSAMYSAEGQVQNLRYTATFPLLLNIEGQPTYFMALKDAAGLVKMFAMVNIEAYQNVAVGDTVQQTQANYLQLLAQQGVLDPDAVQSADGASGASVQVEGTIKTMAQVVIDGNSHFYVTLESGATQTAAADGDGATVADGTATDAPADAIYDFALPDLVGIIAYQSGDKIEFFYIPAAEELAAEDAGGDEASAADGETAGGDEAADGETGDGSASGDDGAAASPQTTSAPAGGDAADKIVTVVSLAA